MKSIIDGKLYDTETATLIFSFRRKVNKGQMWWAGGLYYTPYHPFDLYRTAKGTYFEHDTEDNSIEIVPEEQAKEIVRKLDPDKYMELFNVKVEEG